MLEKGEKVLKVCHVTDNIADNLYHSGSLKLVKFYSFRPVTVANQELLLY